MKMSALQGILLATLILGVLGAVMAEVTVYVNSIDMSALGSYGGYIVAFLNNFPVIIALTWIYNIFMYMYKHQMAALKQVAEQYDTQKLIATLTFFLGILGPIVTFAPAEWKTIASIAVVVVTSLIKWIPSVFTSQTPPPQPKPV
jgi:hypothetical protein